MQRQQIGDDREAGRNATRAWTDDRHVTEQIGADRQRISNTGNARQRMVDPQTHRAHHGVHDLSIPESFGDRAVNTLRAVYAACWMATVLLVAELIPDSDSDFAHTCVLLLHCNDSAERFFGARQYTRRTKERQSSIHPYR